MTASLIPSGTAVETSPVEIVERFLAALAQQDHTTITALLHSDLRYTNISLPTLKGGKMVAGIFKLILNPATGFQVKNHHIASQGHIVLTERTDIINIRPLHVGM